ncbi:MAG: SH3 domain-containing protein [Bdellovibrionales bacterium]|nr:SH3 domain-containing protein [Bdellovibrionales bacterium]
MKIHFIMLIFFVSLCHAKETLYVSSLRSKLLKAPDAKSEIAGVLARGTPIVVNSEQGSWLQVSYKNKSGWILKLFTSKNPPLKNSDVNNLEKLDRDKIGRVRVNYESKGAARGLTDSGPSISRNGYVDNQKFYKSIQSIEQQDITRKQIRKFQIQGKYKP